MAFPTSLDAPTNSTATETVAAFDHSGQHNLVAAAIIAVETKVGVDGSAVTTTHDYKLSGVTGADKAVSKTGTETLTNKTLTAPTITAPTITGATTIAGAILTGTITATAATINVTDSLFSIKDNADATKIAQFEVSTIATGTTRTYTLPNASDTLVGKATTDTFTNKTATGATNTLTASLLKSATTEVSVSAATAPSSGQVLTATSTTTATWQTPTIATLVAKTGVATKNVSDASAAQTIAHGLGTTPKIVKLSSMGLNASSQQTITTSIGAYDGSNSSRISGVETNATGTIATVFSSTSDSIGLSGGFSDPASTGSTGVVTVDGTNITITWTKHGAPSSNVHNIVWEVLG